MAAENSAFLDELSAAKSSTGQSLAELSDESPLLVVFLRHSGCAFCRQTLADLAAQRKRIQSGGARIVVVHMDEPTKILGLAAKYGVDDVVFVADPDQKLYAAFGLARGTIGQILGPSVIWRGLKAAVAERHGWGMPASDIRQLPGAFLLHRRQLVRAFRHQTAADRPDFGELSCPVEATKDSNLVTK